MRRALLLSAIAFVTSCRTRPYEFVDATPEMAVPDGAPGGAIDSGRDAAIDLAPDFAVPLDLTVLPDFAPPPDLVLPFICREVYVVDASSRKLYWFETGSATFHEVGTLGCQPMGNASPETMSVARDGTAWIFYDDSELFHVDLMTAACSPTAFDPAQLGGGAMGSGFSADQPGGTSDTLFVAPSSTSSLGRVDLKLLKYFRIADLAGPAELTGTGAAELWTFIAGGQPFIARVNKQTGALDNNLPVPQIRVGGGFAFAFWGGSFWVFAAPSNGTTIVYRVDRQTGAVETANSTNGLHIVGAGVSSCAPIGLDQ